MSDFALPNARSGNRCPKKKRKLILCAAMLLTQAPCSVPGLAQAGAEKSAKSTAEKQTNAPAEKTDSAASGGASDVQGKLLKGSIVRQSELCPILEGVEQTIPPGVDINLSLNTYLNSEVSQKGDEIWAKVSVDVKDGSKVMLPEGWYMRGLVTDSEGQKRHSRDGYVEVTFDRLCSPNGDYELAFPAKFSTKDNTLKSIAKVALIDTAMVTKGAIKGGWLGLQIGGIPAAIASYGIVPGSTAAAGAAWYAYKAARRQGEIRNIVPGEVIKLKTVEPIKLPGFNVKALPSYQKAPPMRGVVLNINKVGFAQDVNDKKAQLLRVDFTFINETKRQFYFRDFCVSTNLGEKYPAEVLSPNNYVQFKKVIAPYSQERGIITFNVDKGKSEYYLILMDHNQKELSRALIK